MRPRLALVAVLAAGLVGVLAAPVAAAPPLVGIADQKPNFLSDPRFLGLGITHARLAVAWDALKSDWQVAELESWMSAAQQAGVRPLITFDRSRLPGRGRKLPTVAQFVKQFRAFHRRYPWITDYSTWNEANFCGQETCRHPELVARYYRGIRRACPSCRVLGADILDLRSMSVWIRRFVKVAGQPRYWGFHNYVTANRFQLQRTKALLRQTTGEIWLTETAGLVARRNKSLIRLPEGVSHAAQVTRFILRDLVRLSPRISRVYLYEWNASSSRDSWDSGFVGPDLKVRPSLAILRGHLRASGVKPGHAKKPPPPKKPPIPVLPAPVVQDPPGQGPPAEGPPADAPPADAAPQS